MKKIKILFWCFLHFNQLIKSAFAILRFEQSYRKELQPWAQKKAIRYQALRIKRLIEGV